jgi:hypothetical protein
VIEISFLVISVDIYNTLRFVKKTWYNSAFFIRFVKYKNHDEYHLFGLEENQRNIQRYTECRRVEKCNRKFLYTCLLDMIIMSSVYFTEQYRIGRRTETT